MRIGFSLPFHGRAAHPEGLITIATRAEALGYDSLWVGERLLAPVHPKAPYPIGDGTHPAQFRSVLDPLEALRFVAGHTERVALGTSVLVLPLYNRIIPARQLTTLDVLSKDVSVSAWVSGGILMSWRPQASLGPSGVRAPTKRCAC